MNEKNNTVQQYLNNELSQKEKKDFEELLKSNKDLAEEVNILKTVQKLVAKPNVPVRENIMTIGEEFVQKLNIE